MRYFRLHQDLRRESGLIMNEMDRKGLRQAVHGDLSLLDDLTVMKARTYKGKYFSQLLTRQVFMYKDSVKEVFDLYSPSLEYRNFCIIDMENSELVQYYSAPVLKIFPAVSPKSERPFKSANKLYLDKKTVEEMDGIDIFRLTDPENCVVVSLSVAESLMRRKISEILLTHLELA